MRTIAAWFSARPALRFVIWIGVLSLLADVTDEGGRSIAGSYLAVLGATGTMVGLIAGMGELAGYGSRLLSGVLSDRLQRLWLFMWIGYFVNLVAIPLLALAGRWEIAAALLIMVSSTWFTERPGCWEAFCWDGSTTDPFRSWPVSPQGCKSAPSGCLPSSNS
jgi:hypothetical protein